MSEQLKFDDENFETDDIARLAANENFGIKYLYPWQRLVVANILDAANNCDSQTDCPSKQIVLLPTGAGKSLCFQIPALLLKGPTLVIYPLLALMTDQERRMQEGSLRCVVFRGGQTEEQREENFKKLEEGAKIIIANPEVLANDKLTERLSKIGISHVAIDEVHCLSEWGLSFRPAYLELGPILKKLNCQVITAFTATASPEVLENVSRYLFDGQAHIVRSDSDRPNIHYYVRKVASKKQSAILLAGTEPRPMIIFCSTRGRTEDMARDINMVYGPETARFYHAGLEREEKTEIENWFFNQKNGVLCATCAYGMGVDKKDIHTVVHLDPPATAEAYIQEAGRGGRDGSVANAILLWSQEDSLKYTCFSRESRYKALKDFAETDFCRRQVLLDALGAEKAVCDGCDICDRKKINSSSKIKNRLIQLCLSKDLRNLKSALNPLEKSLPGDGVPEDYELAFSLVKLGNKYFSADSLKEVFLNLMNYVSRKAVGVNIWFSEDFDSVYKGLISQHRVRNCNFLWKGKIMVNKKNRRKSKIRRFIRFIKLYFTARNHQDLFQHFLHR